MKMVINGRTKGASGERQFCKWLKDNLSLDQTPTRNLEQTRSGGHDVLVGKFVFEVKRVEKLQLQKWWLQVVKATEKIEGGIPIVAFRQNKQPWTFLVSAKYLGALGGYIQLPEPVFKTWIQGLILTDPSIIG